MVDFKIDALITDDNIEEQLAKQQKFFALGLLSLKPCVLSIFKKISVK